MTVVLHLNWLLPALNLLSSTSLLPGNELSFIPFNDNNCVVSHSRCGPCQGIAPIFERLSNTYAGGTVFIKVDVDKCPTTAQAHSVTAMPTFIFFRNKTRLARIQGADAQALEMKIIELAGQTPPAGDGATSSVAGHIDLCSMILKSGTECLNESDDHTLQDALTPGTGSYLESDCDEQLIINIAFSQNVKLHSLKIQGPADQGPKTIKVFMNQPQTLDFDRADSMEPVQLLELSPKDLTSKEPIPLRFVKFQNVSNIQLFIKDNQSGAETTIIHHLSIIGSPMSTTNMNDFKRIAGKKGESH